MSYSEHDERRLYRAHDKISRQIGVSDREREKSFYLKWGRMEEGWKVSP